LNRRDDDIEDCLECKLDLDDGNADWRIFPTHMVPSDMVGPIKKKVMEKVGDNRLFTKHRNIWICGYQSHKTTKEDPIDPLHLGQQPHGRYKGS
jgi:hypothetical protein